MREKELIIFNLLRLEHTGEERYKDAALELLILFASQKNVTLYSKRQTKVNFEEAFENFVLNAEGYNNVIPELYAHLK